MVRPVLWAALSSILHNKLPITHNYDVGLDMDSDCKQSQVVELKVPWFLEKVVTLTGL